MRGLRRLGPAAVGRTGGNGTLARKDEVRDVVRYQNMRRVTNNT